jgi:hypothetical protein
MAKQALVILSTVVAFGILVPWYKGFTFLDPRMIAAYGCLALLFVAPASADASATDPDNSSTGSVLGRIALVVAFGWGVTVLTLFTAFATLTLAYGHGAFIGPPLQLLAAVLLCSLMASGAVAALSAFLTRQFSPAAGKTLLRFGFLVLLLAFAFSSRLPDRWQIFLSEHTTRRAITTLAWQGSAICAILAVLLLIALVRKQGKVPA